MFSIVVALAKNNVIGSEDKVPWLLRADLVRLKSLIKDNVVILGRKTYESLVWYYNKSGREMPARIYIVVTTQSDYKPAKPKTIVSHSIAQAVEKAAELLSDEAGEVFIIGGAKIFEATLQFVNKLYITEVQATVAGDTFFPVIALDDWQEVSRETHSKDEKNQFDYVFVTLVRRKTIH